MAIIPEPNLASLMAFIAKRLPFTQEEYPDLVLTPEGRRRHAVRHGALHMTKSAGKIAGQAEAADHGGQTDSKVLKEALVSMLISTLRLSEELCMGPDEIVFEVARTLNKT